MFKHACMHQYVAVVQAEATHQLPDLKKMLKLYTSISTSKLAELLHTDVATLTAALQNMQRRIMQKRWVAGDAASGQVRLSLCSLLILILFLSVYDH
jgi:hypothetical protein